MDEYQGFTLDVTTEPAAGGYTARVSIKPAGRRRARATYLPPLGPQSTPEDDADHARRKDDRDINMLPWEIIRLRSVIFAGHQYWSMQSTPPFGSAGAFWVQLNRLYRDEACINERLNQR